MLESTVSGDMLSLEDAEREFGLKRSTLYRYIRKGLLQTYRRAMDKRTYVRRADLEQLRRFQPAVAAQGPTLVAAEQARAFQYRHFGNRIFETSTADLIEEGRRERDAELP